MTQRVARSLTLLWALVGVTAIVLAAGGVVLGAMMTSALRRQALDDAKVSLAQYTSGVLSRRLVEATRDPRRRGRDRDRRAKPRRPPRHLQREGLAHATACSPGPPSPPSASAAASRSAMISRRCSRRARPRRGIEELGRGRGRGRVEAPGRRRARGLRTGLLGRRRCHRRLRDLRGRRAVEASIAGRKHEIWLAIAAVFFLLWAAARPARPERVDDVAPADDGAPRALRRAERVLRGSRRALSRRSRA